MSVGNSTVTLTNALSEKDLGVIFDQNLSFQEEINTRVSKANSITGIIRRTYSYLDAETFKLLFTSLVRPHLEYGAPIWYPSLKRDVNNLEKVQRWATKLIPGFQKYTYEERLRQLKLPTLRFRRLRGDMIEVFKMMTGQYDTALPCILSKHEDSTTRGHSFKLKKERANTSVKLNFFKNRVINYWNRLPQEVISAPSLNSFKNRLDAHWKTHPLLYEWDAESATSTLSKHVQQISTY